MSAQTLADTSDGANYRGSCAICGYRIVVPIPGGTAPAGTACGHFAHVDDHGNGQAWIVCTRAPQKIKE